MTSFRRCDFARDIPDVYSPSMWAGWYSGNYREYEQSLLTQRERVKRFIHVEWGADSQAGRHSEDPEPILRQVATGKGTAEAKLAYLKKGDAARVSTDGDWSETYACNLFDWHLKTQEKLDWFTGSAQWIFKDFVSPLRVANRLGHVSPRVGLAWTPYPDGRTVIHGAAGLFYGSIGGNLFTYPSNGEPFSGRPSFSNVIHVSDPYATDPKDFCNGDATCIAGGVGHSPFPFIYNPKNPQFVVKPAAIIPVDPNFDWPVTYQVNFGVQQQLTRALALSASYVGSMSRKLPIEWDINYPVFNLTSAGATGAACADLTQSSGYANSSSSTTSTVTNRRPFNTIGYQGISAANPQFSTISRPKVPITTPCRLRFSSS